MIRKKEKPLENRLVRVSSSLERELHHTRVQHERQEQMTCADGTEGQDGDKAANVPAVGDKVAGSQDNHNDNEERREADGILERLERLRGFLPEVGLFGFLAR